MTDQELGKLQAVVNRAEQLKRNIKALGEFIASCKNEVGYLNISMNHKNQNQIDLASYFTAREVFDEFKAKIYDAAVDLVAKLEAEYSCLNLESVPHE